ncbi:MAG: glycosyltransferase [Leptospirillia bacterium]
MKIVHIADRNEQRPGLKDYTVQSKLNNGFIRNGHNVWFFSDRDMARAANPFGNRKLGTGAANRKLIELCENFKPDLIALCKAEVIRADTLARIRRMLPDLRVLQYSVDPMFIDDITALMNAKAPVVDHSFVTTAGPVLAKVATEIAPARFFPNPVDPSIDTFKNHERDDLPVDLFFAGSQSPWTDPDDLRNTAPGAIREKMPEVKTGFYGMDGAPKVWGAAFKDALGQAKMGLNFSQRPPGSEAGAGGPLYLYSSDRVGMYMGNGLLTFSGSLFGLSELYGGDAIVEVDSLEALLDRLRYFMAHDTERKKVAAAGYLLAHAEFNERLVARYMVEATFGQGFTHPYRWPTEAYTP